MIFNRRFLIKALGLLVPGLVIRGVRASEPTPDRFPSQRFSALVDTFVPRDDYPGALDLELDHKLLEQITSVPPEIEQAETALNWLNRLTVDEYGRSFESLELAQRSNLLERLKLERTRRIPQTYLRALRDRTLSLFYTSPEAFRMLDYHPPAHGGYPDYARPPSSSEPTGNG